MYSNIYRFADHTFKINSLYNYFVKFAKEYILNDVKEYEYEVTDSIEELVSWKDTHSDSIGFSNEYLETLLIHSKIATILSKHNTVIFHGSSLYLDNIDNGYIFTAPSGTGKSTHVNILKGLYKDRINYVNDDKPFLSIIENKVYLYGSPWDGKEHRSNNVKSALKGIFIISRSKINFVKVISPIEAINYLIRQIHIPNGIEESNNASDILIKLVKLIPIYILNVDMSNEAGYTSYNIMNKKED